MYVPTALTQLYFCLTMIFKCTLVTNQCVSIHSRIKNHSFFRFRKDRANHQVFGSFLFAINGGIGNTLLALQTCAVCDGLGESLSSTTRCCLTAHRRNAFLAASGNRLTKQWGDYHFLAKNVNAKYFGLPGSTLLCHSNSQKCC